ncbi:alpha/beta fold hydrolase [Actinomadura rubrisoli]|uniref:Alpha/beta fold hydrolase n=1 Tax=Actinomadura rubrisoli TaxID=2530368 RepID=A0A4R5B0S7_9ACTN|nr:alpha/beta fold hydrolase [Actinomadura rubrisoli]TDD78050.1 alpha/beta fold hydrolase [Actinomadura rubrisoli]
MTSSSTFVLVHGAWHYGSLWEPVAEHLRAAGHTVHTPTVAGFGEGASMDASHADGAASIVEYIRERDLDDFVLLGHSFGGTIACKVAEVMPERIRRLVFHSAFVLEDGNSINDELPPAYLGVFEANTVDGGIYVPWELWREVFVNDGDEETARAAFDLLCPTPVRMLADKLDLKRFHALIAEGALRCSYLNCTDDTALPPGPYAWHPRFSSRLGLHRLVQMPGSHEVMFTAPAALAAKSVEAGRD